MRSSSGSTEAPGGSDAPDRPVFIVGSPRSGTGVLHQLLRLHPRLAWITPVTSRALAHDSFFFEGPRTARCIERTVRLLPDAIIPHFYRGPFDGSLRVPGLPETSEGAAIWNSGCPEGDDDYLDETAVTPAARSYFREVVQWHCRYHTRPRFVNKRPQNVLRMRYLHAIFPDAFFVHLVRDGKATAASILSRRRAGGESNWWGARPPGWQTLLDEPPIVQCAWQWQMCVRIGRRDAMKTGRARYHELTYEALTESPEKTLTQLLTAVDLPTDEFFTPQVDRYVAQLENRNDGWKSRLDATERDLLAKQLDM